MTPEEAQSQIAYLQGYPADAAADDVKAFAAEYERLCLKYGFYFGLAGLKDGAVVMVLYHSVPDTRN